MKTPPRTPATATLFYRVIVAMKATLAMLAMKRTSNIKSSYFMHLFPFLFVLDCFPLLFVPFQLFLLGRVLESVILSVPTYRVRW